MNYPGQVTLVRPRARSRCGSTGDGEAVLPSCSGHQSGDFGGVWFDRLTVHLEVRWTALPESAPREGRPEVVHEMALNRDVQAGESLVQ